MYRSQAQEQGEEECHYKAGVPSRLSGVGRHEANVVWAAGATADDKVLPNTYRVSTDSVHAMVSV